MPLADTLTNLANSMYIVSEEQHSVPIGAPVDFHIQPRLSEVVTNLTRNASLNTSPTFNSQIAALAGNVTGKIAGILPLGLPLPKLSVTWYVKDASNNNVPLNSGVYTLLDPQLNA